MFVVCTSIGCQQKRGYAESKDAYRCIEIALFGILNNHVPGGIGTRKRGTIPKYEERALSSCQSDVHTTLILNETD